MHTFTHNSMASLLNLQGVIIYKISETEEGFNIKIGQPRAPANCINCQSKNFNKHGKGRTKKIRHGISVNAKPIFLFFCSKRYLCKDCEHSWTSRPPNYLVEGRKRSSRYCRGQALRTLQTNSFTNTKKQTGLSYTILREILHETMKSKPLIEIPGRGPISLGIDEHGRAKKKLATTITLLRPERKLLGLIAKASSNELVKWVRCSLSNEQRQRVIEISVDMTKSLKKQLKILFPKAKFVIDHFHVIAYLNNLIRDEYQFTLRYGQFSREDRDKLPVRGKGRGIVRLLYQGGQYWQATDKEKIRAVFTVMPKVAELWYIKEEVRAIYRESLDKDEARDRWQFILTSLSGVAQRTLKLHLEDILNYFDNKTTNSFTEGFHTKIKLLKRISFGLRNHQVYVEKLELGFVQPKKLITTHTY
jgi:transposase